MRSTLAALAIFLGGSAAGLASAAAPTQFDVGAFGNQPASRGTAVQLNHPAFSGPVDVQIGTSTRGRAISAVHRRGSAGASRTVVVVGVIHGDERHGRLVTDGLLTAPLPADLDLWIVPTINPDGEAIGSHRNARNVDLNRNWPASWETETWFSSGRYFSGAGPASEREVQVMIDFFHFVDPAVTVWFHTPWNRIDCNVSRVGHACVDYAAAVGSSSSFAPRPGTATDWLMSSGLGVSFVSEFANSAPSAAQVKLHVNAILDLS